MDVSTLTDRLTGPPMGRLFTPAVAVPPAGARELLPMAGSGVAASMPASQLKVHPTMRDGLLPRLLRGELAAVGTPAAGTPAPITAASGGHRGAAIAAGSPGAAAAQADDAGRFVVGALDELSTADATLRMDVLSQAVHHRSKHGSGEPIERLFARSLLEGPQDESASALKAAIERVFVGSAPASARPGAQAVTAAGVPAAVRASTPAAAAAAPAAAVVAPVAASASAPAVAAAAASGRVAVSLAPASGTAVPSLEAAILAITRATPRI